ncbi:hypothetical protein AMTRI_Chr07g82310 [Amborella trichopoda]
MLFFLSTTQFFPSKLIFYLFWVECLNCVFLLLHIRPLYLRLPPNPRFITLRLSAKDLDRLVSSIFLCSSFFLLFLPLIEVILMDKIKVDIVGNGHHLTWTHGLGLLFSF